MIRTEVSYRTATAADLPALRALGHQVSLFHHAALPDVFVPPAESARDTALWAQAIDGEGCVAIVAERGSRIIGFVTGAMETEQLSLFWPKRYCCVGVMGVVQAERGGGVGSALMNALEQWALSHSAAEVHLNVWTFNDAARRLYAELGYDVRTELRVKRLGPAVS